MSCCRGGEDPPVLLALGGELIIESGGAAVDPVGRGGAVVLAQPAVRQVQHGAPLERLQAGCGDEAGDGHGLLTELQHTHTHIHNDKLRMCFYPYIIKKNSLFLL